MSQRKKAYCAKHPKEGRCNAESITVANTYMRTVTPHGYHFFCMVINISNISSVPRVHIGLYSTNLSLTITYIFTIPRHECFIRANYTHWYVIKPCVYVVYASNANSGVLLYYATGWLETHTSRIT